MNRLNPNSDQTNRIFFLFQKIDPEPTKTPGSGPGQNIPPRMRMNDGRQVEGSVVFYAGFYTPEQSSFDRIIPGTKHLLISTNIVFPEQFC